ncbi:MAG TPA: hypothetical protein VGM62_19175 [Chthoniobacterales bacterium]
MIRPQRLRFFIGLIAGLAGALLLGELTTRLRPPEDLLLFLGDASPLTGMYRPDPELGADYRSVEDFRERYRERLRELEEPSRPKQTWAWFGNSFVQAQGMLGDMAQADRPDIRMFYLRQNTELPERVAQLRLLLDSGFKPERVIMVLLPIDLIPLGKQPLNSIAVNSRGAITYRWRPAPPPLDALLRSSRFAQLAWIRSGRSTGKSPFQPRSQSDDELPITLKKDLTTIFRVAAATCRTHNVPLTVLLLPNREQIFGKAGYTLQDFERERCRAEGIDCFDARNLFVNETDKLSLFLPDWHFTDKGNRMILDALYSHWQQQKKGTSQQ